MAAACWLRRPAWSLPLTEFPCSRPWPGQGDGHLPAYFPLRSVQSRDELYSAGAGPAFDFTVVPIPGRQELWGVGLPVGVGCFPPTGGVFQKEHTVWLHGSPSAIVFLSPLLQFHVLVSWTSTCGPLDHTIHVLTPLLNRIQWPACLSLPARGPHGPRPEQNPRTALWVAPFGMPCGHPLAPLSFWAQ